MNHYMLLLHTVPGDFAALGPAQMKEMAERYGAWSRQLAERGRLVAGDKLTDDGGRQLRLQGGAPVAIDGPYAEAKDVVGGFFTIKAETDGEAETMASTCPHLIGRNWIEVRRIDPMK